MSGKCSFEGCGNEGRGRDNLCSGHKWQQDRGRPLTPLQERLPNKGRVCVESGCFRPAVRKMLCAGCYEKRRRNAAAERNRMAAV